MAKKTTQERVDAALLKTMQTHGRANTKLGEADVLSRVADYLARATHEGPCDYAPARCINKPQPNRTWAEYEVSAFCDSCATYWHASNASHLLEAHLHALEVDHEERKALTETPDALEKCVHCHEQYCDSYEDDQPVHAKCCKAPTRVLKGRRS